MKIPPPVARLIGFELVRIEGGESTVEMEADERHANPMGTLHGGILCDLADAAMGSAYYSTLDEGHSFTTLELKINFVRPFWTGKLVAQGRVVQRGRTVGLAECDVVDEQGRLIARATSTCMTLQGDAASGR
ncbi:MAG: PaaI family thioesterase [Actinomycetota bacterium]|nr:PaaI family thioesterase [Actinomycetota bacterium]